jgi:hypothetical protein
VTLPHVYGHPDVPLSDAENQAKFHRCLSFAAAELPAAKASALIDAIADLEQLEDISTLIALTKAGSQ